MVLTSLATVASNGLLLGVSDIITIAQNAQAYLARFGSPWVTGIGTVLLLYAAFTFARALTGAVGRSGPHWWRAFGSVIFGGGMFFLGWKMMTELGASAQGTVNQLTGMALPLLPLLHLL